MWPTIPATFIYSTYIHLLGGTVLDARDVAMNKAYQFLALREYVFKTQAAK